MLLRRAFFPLAVQHSQGVDDAGTRFLRLDDAVYIAVFRRFVRRGKFRNIFLLFLFFLRIALKDDVGRAVRTHDGDFSRWPGKYHVRAELAAAHGDVRAAVGLARNDGYLRHRRFAVRVEHLRAVADDAAEFLRRSRQEARHVDEGDERDVEAVAEADEAGRLIGRVDVQAAGQEFRLVGNDADGLAVEAGEASNDI